jgi:hypothetical protein
VDGYPSRVQKNVLQLVTLSETGWAQKAGYFLAAGLDRERFEVTAACGPGGELMKWLEKLPMVKAENYQWLLPNIMLK